eukprot:1698812-Lingulodinium_polyedra.AAC.1
MWVANVEVRSNWQGSMGRSAWACVEVRIETEGVHLIKELPHCGFQVPVGHGWPALHNLFEAEWSSGGRDWPALQYIGLEVPLYEEGRLRQQMRQAAISGAARPAAVAAAGPTTACRA